MKKYDYYPIWVGSRLEWLKLDSKTGLKEFKERERKFRKEFAMRKKLKKVI